MIITINVKLSLKNSFIMDIDNLDTYNGDTEHNMWDDFDNYENTGEPDVFDDSTLILILIILTTETNFL